ncbi:MAG: DUF3841 domain-containing protein, partial [Desulfobacterales bacterium]|nr:DUF3841 domain-containing protein [Desulfobacterales bacterium]
MDECSNEKGVRIEFECLRDDVLLSDYDLWHYALNYWYLAETETNSESFEAELEKHGLSFCRERPLPNAKLHDKIKKSWEKIFDIDWFSSYVTY